MRNVAQHEAALLHHALPGLGLELWEGLGGGIGFMYSVFEFAGMDPILTIVAQPHPDRIVPGALDRAGVPHVDVPAASRRGVLAQLAAATERGQLACCRVSRYALPWQPDLPTREPWEVLVTGVATDEIRIVDIVDGQPQAFALPPEVFLDAWGAVRQARHALILITPEAAPVLSSDGVHAAVGRAADLMLEPVLGNAFDVNFGLRGLRKLANEVGASGKAGWQSRFATDTAFTGAMRRLHDCIDHELTSPGASRLHFGEFLERTAVFGAPAAPTYRQAGELWCEVADLALAAANEPSTPVPALTHLASLLEQIVALEEHGAAALAAFAGR